MGAPDPSPFAAAIYALPFARRIGFIDGVDKAGSAAICPSSATMFVRYVNFKIANEGWSDETRK